MKKESKAHLRVCKYRAKKRPADRKLRKETLRKRTLTWGTVRRAQIPSQRIAGTLYPPAEFCLVINYSEVVKFLAEIRALPVRPTRTAKHEFHCVDLSTIRYLEPSAAVCLVAELDRWQRLSGRPLQARTLNNWDPEVRRLLSAVGFFKLLGTTIPPHASVGLPASERVWFEFSSHTVTDGKAAKALRQKMQASFGSLKKLKLHLYGPLIEAIKNAVEHAYPPGFLSDTESNRIGQRWWMLGAVDRVRLTVSISILDVGVSIPRSLPGSSLWSSIAGALLPGYDSDDKRLLSAFEYGRSRTHLPERGKGLPQIIALVDQHPDNHVRVYSRRGFYHASGTRPGVSTLHGLPFSGTLIHWELALPTDAQDA
jgi:hypothetical protein